MVTPAAGSVVLVLFPFSDLSSSKLRPAVVMARAVRGDLILCQVTSNPYLDPLAVELTDDDFASGSLKRTSYARPAKLFTASESILKATAGYLNTSAFNMVVDTTIAMLMKSRDER